MAEIALGRCISSRGHLNPRGVKGSERGVARRRRAAWMRRIDGFCVAASLEFDSRDMPLNSYSGLYLKADALFNDEAPGSDNTYQSYSLAFRSYHEISELLVLAWELQACQRNGSTPLWDSCTIKLRGFSATDYLGKTSASGQLEARWRLNGRWGLAGFAGAGKVGSSFSDVQEHEAIPSYGVGIHLMVLAAKRINLRVDYARSKDSDAIHISVGEAF